MNLEQIAYNIKFFREQNEWSQQELSEKLMISRTTITRWETNATLPDIASLIKLSNIFDVSIDHIVGNHSFREDLLKDFKRIYSSKTKAFDEEVVELIEYLMVHAEFKDQLYRLKTLSWKKQKTLHSMFKNMIDEIEQL